VYCSVNLSPSQTKIIEATLEDYISNPEPDVVNLDPPLDMRKLAGELNLLPLLLDMGGCVGIRLNGKFCSLVWDEPYELIPETEVRICNIALFEGAKRFPRMIEFIPPKPPSALECDYCHGSGTVADLPPDLAKNFRCYCGGLGWIP
jgi:hypothetical protein